ncbi:insulin receptor substrate 1-B-like [Pollicipes pollicipes]|uniref:insulin receptor substrate 1-B-like n=1 Tax=Pollicipes pollicipes TaxID=41117 RepID=UPI0018856A59|nr:insulin receptor substrate 1-B-like [Pollicipes pollicipes]
MADAQDDVAKTGYLKVRRKDEKKFKKRWAVLRQDTASMDIYESDKKWKTGDKCKMSIPLPPCFSVSTKVEPKCKYAIGLMGVTSYSLGLETEEEQTDWLLKLRWVHQGGRHPDDEQTRTQYERMWDVTITDRGLGSTKKINGQYCVGLTADGIQLINKDNPKQTYDLPFTTIRGCRHVDCFFWMEVGRTSCFGAGEINMQLEERIYAQNMHEVMKAKFNSRSSESESQTGESRPRAPSASEPSRPISVKGRRNTYSSNNSSQTSVNTISLSTTPGRDRSGSVPNRPRTTSEGNSDRHHGPQQGHHTRARAATDARTHAIHSRSSSMTAGSPPLLGSPFSPASVESNSSYSMDEQPPMCHPITPDSIIVEETGDYLPVNPSRAFGHDLADGPGRRRVLPPLSLALGAPAAAAAESPYLPMNVSPSAGAARHGTPAGADAAYLPMFYSGGADTPDNCVISPTPSQGHLGHHSRDSSLTEDSYVPMLRVAADIGADDASYMSMKPGLPPLSDDISHSRSSSAADQDGYVPMVPGQLSFTVDAASPYMDVQPGKRASKISDDSYAEVSPASSCTCIVWWSDTESMRTRASSLGSRLSHALMPRRRDRSESDSTSTERPSTGEPGGAGSSAHPCGSPSLSSSLDSTVTSLKDYYRRRRKGSELREEAGSPAAESKGSQDSLRHRPRSNSQSSQGSDKAHSGWRLLFKRRDKKNGSAPVDVPLASPSGDYLTMDMSARRTSTAGTADYVNMDRELAHRPAGSRRDPDTYCVVEVPARPVSALLSVQTEPDVAGRRKSDTTPLDERRRQGPGKVQRKNSAGGGGGLLRKLDAMNPRTMFRSLSQRGKKEHKRLSPSSSQETPPPPPPPSSLDRSPSWLGSSQSLSSSNSIQEERPQTGVGSQSLTTLPTEEQELVYASLDLAENDAAGCQPLAGAHKLTYAKIDFNKSETHKCKRDG